MRILLAFLLGYLLVTVLLITAAQAEEVRLIPIFQDTWIQQGVSSNATDMMLDSRASNPKRQIILEWAEDLGSLSNVTDAYMVFRNFSYNSEDNNGQVNFCLCRRLTSKHSWNDSWTWLDFQGALTVSNGSLESDFNRGLQVIAGDANLDGIVDVHDLNILALNWLQEEKGWIDGDFNYDGVVNTQDLNFIGINWQNTIPEYPADVMICDITDWIIKWENGEVQNGVLVEPFSGFWNVMSSESNIPDILFTPPVLYIHSN